METKVCFKCGISKVLSEFYAHKEMADGHLGKCKECTKRDVKKYAKTNAGRASQRRRDRTPERRKWHAEYSAKRRKMEPLKRAARVMVGNAIRDGRLKRGRCEVCLKKKVEAHHDDYYKPLDVRWLCTKHHKELHACSKVNTVHET